MCWNNVIHKKAQVSDWSREASPRNQVAPVEDTVPTPESSKKRGRDDDMKSVRIKQQENKKRKRRKKRRRRKTQSSEPNTSRKI